MKILSVLSFEILLVSCLWAYYFRIYLLNLSLRGDCLRVCICDIWRIYSREWQDLTPIGSRSVAAVVILLFHQAHQSYGHKYCHDEKVNSLSLRGTVSLSVEIVIFESWVFLLWLLRLMRLIIVSLSLVSFCVIRVSE